MGLRPVLTWIGLGSKSSEDLIGSEFRTAHLYGWQLMLVAKNSAGAVN